MSAAPPPERRDMARVPREAGFTPEELEEVIGGSDQTKHVVERIDGAREPAPPEPPPDPLPDPLAAPGRELPLLERAVLALAGECDGAVTRDGVGFNKEDAPFLNPFAEMVKRGDLIPRSHRRKVLQKLDKYHKQLAARGYTIADIAKDEEDRKMVEKATVKDEDGPAYAADFPELVDLVERDGAPVFLVKRDGKTEVLSEFEGKSPPPKVPWLLPRASEVLRYIEEDSDAKLYDDLREWHRSAADLPEEVYDVQTIHDFHTHLQESANFSPVVIFEAAPERGKSRSGRSMVFVARRGIVVESLRDPYLIRAANDLGATLFFDVRDIWKKAEKTGTEDILLQRFERGATVPRVVYPDRGPFADTLYYSIFGPTIIGTNETPDGLLDSRGYTIRPPDTLKKFETEITKEAGLPYRERLVAFRARHLGEVLPPVAKPCNGRLGDISRPLLQILRLVRPEREDSFKKFLKGQELARTAGKRESFEGRVLAAVLRLAWKVADGKLATKEITEEVNRGVPEKWQTTAAKVGRTLWHLGFERGSTKTSGSALLWDPALLARLAEKHGLDATAPPTPSENPPNHPKAPNPPGGGPKTPHRRTRAGRGGGGGSDGSGISEGFPTGYGGRVCACGIQGEWPGPLCPLCARDPGRRRAPIPAPDGGEGNVCGGPPDPCPGCRDAEGRGAGRPPP